MEISIDVEDVAESDISLAEYANRYLSQKGNTVRKGGKSSEPVHPKFAIALAATHAKTSKGSRGGSNAFAAFADAEENTNENEEAVAEAVEEDDDDGWNTVPARHQVPTHPWHRAARKSFGADHHRPSFNSSNKTTGVYFDARRHRRPSIAREDVNDYFEPRVDDIEWAQVDTSKTLSSFSISGSHAQQFDEFEKWKREKRDRKANKEAQVQASEVPKGYPEFPPGLHPSVREDDSSIGGVFDTVKPVVNNPIGGMSGFSVPLSPPVDRSGGFVGQQTPGHCVGQVHASPYGHRVLPPTAPLLRSQFVQAPLSPPETEHALPVFHHGNQSRGFDSRPPPNFFGPPGVAIQTGHPVPPGDNHNMSPGPFFAVVLPPDIVDQVRRGLIPPPPPPPPVHMMWRGGPLPPGVGIPVPIMPW